MSKYFFDSGRYEWAMPMLRDHLKEFPAASEAPTLRLFQEAWQLYHDIYFTGSVGCLSQVKTIFGIDAYEYGVGPCRLALPNKHRDFYAVLELRFEQVLLFALIDQQLISCEPSRIQRPTAKGVIPFAA